MKLVFGVVFVLIFFNACSGQPEAEPIVKIIDSCGNSNISIRDIKGVPKQDGFMRAQVVGYNSSNQYQLLKYRIVWIDRDGIKIDSILSKWNDVSAYAKQPFYINEVSPNAQARTFRVYIKKDKEVICDKQYDGQ